MQNSLQSNSFSHKRILVTGANGFIGTNLCAELKAEEYEVTSATRAEFDLEKPEQLSADLLRDIDTVVHLAARVHVIKETVSHPVETFLKINGEGTVALAKAAVTAGVKRFIFISTIKVLGEQTSEGEVFSENSFLNPCDAYAMSKAYAEKELQQLVADTDMELIIIRPPLVYGDGAGGNYQALVKLIKSGIPVPFKGINNKRSMIHVSNLCAAIIRSIEVDIPPQKPLLVRDKEMYSTPEFIRLIARRLNKKPMLIKCPLRIFKMLAKISPAINRKLERLRGSQETDISYTCKTLEWQPKPAQELLR